MDWVTVSKQQVDDDALPLVCMVCGEPATHRANKTFTHTPPWVEWLYFLFIIPGAIAEYFFAQQMRVSCPVCKRHRNHWSFEYWFLGAGWIVFVGLGALLGIAAASIVETKPYMILAIGAFVGVLAWAAAAVYVHSTRIKASKVTTIEICFEGVHHGFAKAVKDLQGNHRV